MCSSGTLWFSLPAGSLHRAVLLDSCRDAVVRNVRNWAHGFMVGLRELGYAFTIRCDALEPVDLPRVRQLLAQPTERVWQELHICPRTCPSGGAVLCTYRRWFARPPWAAAKERHAAHLPIAAGALRAFLRFRAGCHGLPNDAGRRSGVPRQQRTCARCGGSGICDERHLVFECPAVQPVRDQYAGLFTGPGQTMVQFMWQQNLTGVALFVRDALAVLLAFDH